MQGLAALCIFGFIGHAIYTAEPSPPPRGPKPYIANPEPVAPPKPAYERPAKAPNGSPWPFEAGYVAKYPRLNANGYSKVTIDNSQNDSDVFVKIVTLDGRNAMPVRQIFIPARASFTVSKMTAGNYDVRYMDLASGHRARSEAFELKETRQENGVQFSDFTMTLYKVRNGNMQTYELAEDEF